MGMERLRLAHEPTNDLFGLIFLLLCQPDGIHRQVEGLMCPRQELVETLDQERVGKCRVITNLSPLLSRAVARRRLGDERREVVELVVFHEELFELGDPGDL